LYGVKKRQKGGNEASMRVLSGGRKERRHLFKSDNMCSIIGKGDKLETMIHELSDELEELKEREKRKDKEMKEVLEDLKKLVSEQSDRIKKIEEKFEKTFSEQRREIDNILEKVAEVDFNRRNNLIFNGLPSEPGESQEKLYRRVREIIKNELNIQRQVTILGVSRAPSGPDFQGCRPVLVTFQLFKDRFDVLTAARAVGSKLSVAIAEEFSRKSRDARQELRRYMREVRRNSPEKLCRIHYDKLLVDDKVFIFSEGRIVEEAKKKNEVKLVRSVSELSGQVEEPDKERKWTDDQSLENS